MQQYGTIAVDYNGRIERVTTDTEQDITNAIVKAVEGGEKKVYFSQGHGERDTTSADQRNGYNVIAGALQRDNFAVDKVVLAQQQDVPADAAVLVIAGPKNDFLQPELDMVQRYLDKGGKLLLLIDPPDGADAAPLTGLIALAKAWGVDVGTNVVVDVSSVGQLLGAGPSVPVVATYPDHPITENFGLITAFPLARAVTPVEGGTNGRTAQPIATTSAQSWAETDLKAVFAGTPVQRDEAAGEKEGPVTLGGRRRRRRAERQGHASPAASGARAGTAGHAGQAADPCRRDRRLGLRHQRRPRHAGQSRLLPQCA